MRLPKFVTSDKDLTTLQTRWSSIIDPVLALPQSSSVLLVSIPLVIGVNVINHTLGRLQQGWVISDIDAIASIYRSAPFNNSTLTLTSNANCVVTLEVF